MSALSIATPRLLGGLAVLPLLLSLGGCPQPGGDDEGPVTAVIAISSTSGPAPLTISVSGTGSTSTAGDITRYQWEFGTAGTSAASTTAFTFTSPGRYVVKLSVTDSAGNTGVATQEVRVQGVGPVTADIQASTEAGPAPLYVEFDGTASSGGDDSIYDYFWDFGDGRTSRSSQPWVTYALTGDYVVTLRVVTGGGLEATTQKTIRVGAAAAASLQFAGNQWLTLPFTAAAPLGQLTFEAWVKPDAAGGLVASFGAQELTVQVLPASREVRVGKDGDTLVAITGNLAGSWHHVAVSFDGTGTTSIYVDGQLLKTGALAGTVSATTLIAGQGYEGKLARIGLWSTIRTAQQIAAGQTAPPTASEAGLLGFWMCNEGSGQTVASRSGGNTGMLGQTMNQEGFDPTWVVDAP